MPACQSETRFTCAARRASALKKLGVSGDQLARADQITPLLQGTRGGRKAMLEAMRYSKDPVVQCFLVKFDSLGVWARENTPWEAIALAAGIAPSHLLGAALMAQWEHTMTAARIIAMSHHPELVKKRIECAKLPGGWRDRDALDKLLGFLQTNHPWAFKKSASRTA